MPSTNNPQGLREHLRTTIWILDFYESQKTNISTSTGWRRFMRKQSRERFKLIIRARWHGFDVNETIYLLGLYDEAQIETHGYGERQVA